MPVGSPAARHYELTRTEGMNAQSLRELCASVRFNSGAPSRERALYPLCLPAIRTKSLLQRSMLLSPAIGYEDPDFDTLLDGNALRHELTALAQDESESRLRKAALVLIKERFSDARLCVKAEIESGAWDGVRAAQALSHIQDTLIRVLYDFATKHVYYAQNPT